MPRMLREGPAASDRSGRDRSLARSTARAFAAAISALVISTLVVSRTEEALGLEGTIAANSFTAGTVLLSDDDRGQSLFDLSAMVPGRPVERCIEVSYDGTILPADLTIQASGQGALLAFLDVSVESGSGGRFGSCAGFRSEDVVFRGGFDRLQAAGRLPLATLYNTGEARSYRIRFNAADGNEPLGLGATIDFVWEVSPS